MSSRSLWPAPLCLALAACFASEDAQRPGTTLDDLRREVFEPSCVSSGCHDAIDRAADLDLTAADLCAELVGSRSCLFPTMIRVVPGAPDVSFLIDKMAGEKLDKLPTNGCASSNNPMPPVVGGVDSIKLARVEAWIAAGAPGCAPPGPADAGVGDKPDADPDDPDAGPSQDVESIVPAQGSVLAGEVVEVTVTLAGPAPAGGQEVDIDLVDPTVLSAPGSITIDGGQDAVTFEVEGLRPSHASSIAARGGATTVEAAIAVTGLELAEVFYDHPTSDDSLEWIKLKNRSSVPIDLSLYSLGNGRSTHTFTKAQPTGTLAAGACFVVGGPSSTAGNGLPTFDQVLDFSPDLTNGSNGPGQASGYVLFDRGIL